VRGEDVSDDLFALSCEPDLQIRVYSACIVDVVRCHNIDREKNRRTQNSGVMAQGTHTGEDIEFYGCLREIIQLQYNVITADTGQWLFFGVIGSTQKERREE
jgi:hypothetical protein